MALFKWLTTIEGECITSALLPHASSLGLDVDQSLSHAGQLFATEPVPHPASYLSRVTILATWSDQASRQVQIEVRSDEPLLRAGTRCEQLASALKQRLNVL